MGTASDKNFVLTPVRAEGVIVKLDLTYPCIPNFVAHFGCEFERESAAERENARIKALLKEACLFNRAQKHETSMSRECTESSKLVKFACMSRQDTPNSDTPTLPRLASLNS